MKNTKLSIHYVICAAALLVLCVAFFMLYKNPERTKSLTLTIIGCGVVAVGQFLIIRQRKSKK